MQRRSFLLWSAAGAGAAAVGAGLWRWQEIAARAQYPGRAEGHFLRDRHALPPPSGEIRTDVLIVGSGVAGLTAAWRLRKLGVADVLMLEGPQTYGNCAGAMLDAYACPTAAHYLPLPSPESTHIREMLSDLGIILRNPMSERPYYDERYILHAPEERLLINGIWQDGFVPNAGVAPWELDEQQRFFREVDRLRQLRGQDGRRIFVFPTVLSSNDEQWQALDHISLKDWLDQNGYRAPTLHWYLNYCCRDDYGTNYTEVSAWAGLHYYCSRWGQAENAGNGAWLTWPDGLHPLAQALDRAGGAQHLGGTAARMKIVNGRVEALCFELKGNEVRTFTVRARRAIAAMPLYVAAHVVEPIRDFGFDALSHLPAYAPWMVSNFLMNDFPRERTGTPLCWDNVVYQGPGLGYVVSTHQEIRAKPPQKTVFTAYRPFSDRTPQAARAWIEQASVDELLHLASVDLKSAYGWRLAPCVERVDIMLRGHAMAAPLKGFRNNAGANALREIDRPILFAHSDLSGFSVFEEAAWWGDRAARLAAA